MGNRGISSAKVVNELKAIEGLANDRNGPIADTYDRLQGLIFLRAAQVPVGVKAPNDRVYIALHQARALSLMNVSSLLRRATRDLQAHVRGRFGGSPPMLNAAPMLKWAHSLLKISYSITRASQVVLPSVASEYLSTEPAICDRQVIDSLSELDTAFVSYEKSRTASIATAIGHRYFMDGEASGAHNFKTVYHLMTMLLSLDAPSPRVDLLSLDILDLAVHSLDTKTPTYLMQFRLLHQIPEVLGAEVGNLMQTAKGLLARGSDEEALIYMRLTRELLVLIVDCLWPLVENMYPSEYYKIRKHLGVTSGSKSRMLAERILKEDYLELAKIINERSTSGHGSPSLLHEFRGVHSEIKRWRDLHIFLPWSVLGKNATSLIGSKRASDTVRGMAHRFARDDPLNFDKPADLLGMMPTGAIDTLLDITGRVTQRRFPDVEARIGRYLKKD